MSLEVITAIIVLLGWNQALLWRSHYIELVKASCDFPCINPFIPVDFFSPTKIVRDDVKKTVLFGDMSHCLK